VQSKLIRGISSKDFWLSNIVYIALMIFIIVFGVLYPNFVKPQNILNIFTQSCTLILVGIGMTMALITRGIDLSVGATLYFSALIMYMVGGVLDLPVSVMILLGSLIGLVIGMLNGLLVGVLKIFPLLPTLAMQFIIRGLGITIMLNVTHATRSIMPMKWGAIISTKLAGIPVYLYVTIIVAVVMQLLLSNTQIGRNIYAVGDNAQVAMQKGINIFRTKFFVHSMCGLMAGIAAVVSSGQAMDVSYATGEGFEFKVVTACVLGGVGLKGGKGSVVPGVIVGALLLSVISNVLVILKASVYSYDVAYALVIFVVVLLDTIKIKTVSGRIQS